MTPSQPSDLPRNRALLRARWTELHGKRPPDCLSIERLMKGIRYAEQLAADPELARIDREVNRRIKELARQKRPSTKRILPGTRLLREWRGTTHEVTVTSDGYRYQGTTYRSLSAIAEAITGTRWSGPKFFGVA